MSKKILQGDNFISYSNTKNTYPYNAFIEIEEELAQELELSQAQIRLSLQYLYDKHPEMFENKREVYKTAKMLVEFYEYAGDSLKDDTLAYLAKRDSKGKMSDMVINRETNGVIHLNYNKEIKGKDKEVFQQVDNQRWRPAHSPHRQQLCEDSLVSAGQMNTSQEHFSLIDSKTISQDSEANLKEDSKESEDDGEDMGGIRHRRKLR